MKTKKMNLVKTFISLCILIVSSATFAQPGGGKSNHGGPDGPPPMPDAKQIKEMILEIKKELLLNPSQETRITALYNEHFAKGKEMTSGNSRPNREEMEELKKKFEANIKACLNKQQQEKYIAFLKTHNPPNQKR